MKIKLEIIVIIALVLLFIGYFFYSDYQKNRFETENRELRNQLVLKDKIILEKDNSYSKLSYEFTTQTEMYDLLKNENSKLASELKKKDEKIAYLLSITIKPDTVYIVVDSLTYIKDSIAYFSGYTRPYKVSGEVHLKDSTTKNLKVMMDEIKLLIIGSKIENGFYKARVRFSDINNVPLDMFKVLDIESAVNVDINSQEPSFLSMALGGEISLYDLNIGTLLNFYGKNFVTVTYRLNDYDSPSNNSLQYKWRVGFYRKIW